MQFSSVAVGQKSVLVIGNFAECVILIKLSKYYIQLVFTVIQPVKLGYLLTELFSAFRQTSFADALNKLVLFIDRIINRLIDFFPDNFI